MGFLSYFCLYSLGIVPGTENGFQEMFKMMFHEVSLIKERQLYLYIVFKRLESRRCILAKITISSTKTEAKCCCLEGCPQTSSHPWAFPLNPAPEGSWAAGLCLAPNSLPDECDPGWSFYPQPCLPVTFGQGPITRVNEVKAKKDIGARLLLPWLLFSYFARKEPLGEMHARMQA